MRSSVLRYLGCLMAGLAGGSLCEAAPSATYPAVIELFTSQGCSSCPPADALLGELAKRPDVIALSYHVDYWNSLGWTDRFASASSTTRQHDYAQALKLSTVFTPQMIVGGEESVLGSARADVLRAISQVHASLAVELRVEDSNLKIRVIEPSGSAPPSNILVVGYLSESSTLVAHGENSGRALREFNIVRFMRSFNSIDKDVSEIRLPLSSIPHEVNEVAVLAQESPHGRILGAAKVRVDTSSRDPTVAYPAL